MTGCGLVVACRSLLKLIRDVALRLYQPECVFPGPTVHQTLTNPWNGRVAVANSLDANNQIRDYSPMFVETQPLSSWWEGLSLAWKIVAAIFGASAVLAAGWKPVTEVWRWGRMTYDSKVLNVLIEGERNARMANPGRAIAVLPTFLAAIASEANRSEKSVYKTLRRLESQGRVYEVTPGKWLLGTRDGSNSPVRLPGRPSSRFTPRAWRAPWED
jgi:hypothetical protein